MADVIGLEVNEKEIHYIFVHLLNGFCKAIKNSMQESGRSMQLCYIVDKLKPESHKVIKEIAEFIKLKESE